MERLYLLLGGSLISCSIFAQTAPTLPKEWNGSLTLTSIGATTVHNPTHKANAKVDEKNQTWNTYTQVRKLTIKKQEGRHLEILVKGPKIESLWVGTLSEDGKEIIYASKHAAGLLKIQDKKMSGCGTSRGTDGDFDHWINSYAAWCWEFTAAN